MKHFCTTQRETLKTEEGGIWGGFCGNVSKASSLNGPISMATGSLHQLGGNRWRLCNRQHMLQWAQAIPTDGGWGGGRLWNITWHFLLIWSYIVTNHKERLSCTSEWLCKNLFKGKLRTTQGISALASHNQAAWPGCILSPRLWKRWIACSEWYISCSLRNGSMTFLRRWGSVFECCIAAHTATGHWRLGITSMFI